MKRGLHGHHRFMVSIMDRVGFTVSVGVTNRFDFFRPFFWKLKAIYSYMYTLVLYLTERVFIVDNRRLFLSMFVLVSEQKIYVRQTKK